MRNPFGYILTITIVLIIIVGLIFGKESMHPMGQIFFCILIILIGGTLIFKGRKKQ